MEEGSKTGAEMELLKLYDCCVPNFRLRPSVARRGEVVVVCQGQKKLMKSGPAWKILEPFLPFSVFVFTFL